MRSNHFYLGEHDMIGSLQSFTTQPLSLLWCVTFASSNEKAKMTVWLWLEHRALVFLYGPQLRPVSSGKPAQHITRESHDWDACLSECQSRLIPSFKSCFQSSHVTFLQKLNMFIKRAQITCLHCGCTPADNRPFISRSYWLKCQFGVIYCSLGSPVISHIPVVLSVICTRWTVLKKDPTPFSAAFTTCIKRSIWITLHKRSCII